MASRSNYKKNYKKKYKKKKRKGIHLTGDKEVIKTGQARRDAVIYRGIGIPNVFFTKLKWNHQFDVNSFPFDSRLFNANGLNPPSGLVIGQPMYFDELQQLYGRYCVLASEITCIFQQKSASLGAAFAKCGLYPLGVSTPALNLKEAIERDNCVYAQLGPNTGDQGIIQMSGYGKSHEIVGLPSDENTDDTMSALMTANPNRRAYWHVFMGTNDNTALTNIYLDVTITYYVRFFDRINVNSS